MEEFLKRQRMELLRQGAPDSDQEDWDDPQWPDKGEDSLDVEEEEEDSSEDADLAFITSILESFSKPKSRTTKPNESLCTTFTPEGVPTQADAKRVTPPKFNHHSMIKRSTTEKFSCFPTIEEEGADEFTDAEETQGEIDTEETELENHLQDICSITKAKKNPFAAWRPFIPQPQEPVFQNLPAQPWWSVSLLPECSSQEPTLATILAIDCLTSKEAIKPSPPQVHPEQTSHQMKQTPQHTGELYKPTTKCYKHSWSRRWPELSRTSKRTRVLRNESPDH
jgi:hypothetical protein